MRNCNSPLKYDAFQHGRCDLHILKKCYICFEKKKALLFKKLNYIFIRFHQDPDFISSFIMITGLKLCSFLLCTLKMHLA